MRRRPTLDLPARLLLPVVASLAALLAAGLLAACGSDADETETVTVPGTTNREEVIVRGSNGDFSPEAVYRKASPAVVTVISLFAETESLIPGSGAGQGSGFVISDAGEIITNAHVVTEGGRPDGGGRLRPARQVLVEFADRNRVPARVVGSDPFSDIALLRVDADGLDLHALSLSDGEGIRVGQPVAAIGSPFGEEQSLSVGVISATDRSIESLTQFRIENAIQTDASINPGNSGGPLLDGNAEVIGINQQIRTASGANTGVGFAVPVNALRFALPQLREDGRVRYAYMGVTTQGLYPQLASELGVEAERGALITDVVDGGPAANAGLRGGDDEIRFQGLPITTGGDVIIAVNGHELLNDNDLSRLVGLRRPGETVTVDVIRDGERRRVEIELGERPRRVPES